MFFFMFCMTILTPVSVSVTGMVMRKHPVRDMNLGRGYRTGRSMKSQEAWDFAQKYCAGIWMRWGAVIAARSAVAILVFRDGDYETVSVWVIGVQFACICLSVVLVEIELSRRF